jgi:hypothetical protein
MLNPAVFEKPDFPAVSLVVCSEEIVAHRPRPPFTLVSGRKRPQENVEI